MRTRICAWGRYARNTHPRPSSGYVAGEATYAKKIHGTPLILLHRTSIEDTDTAHAFK